LEFKIASNIIKEKLDMIKSEFRETEGILKDELKMLKGEIKELKNVIKILHKDMKTIKSRKRKSK